MQSDQELLVFNNQIAHKSVRHWELHQSAPGHDNDELFLQLGDGSVVRIVAEHREFGAALKLEPHSRLPAGRPVRDLPTEYNALANQQLHTPTSSAT